MTDSARSSASRLTRDQRIAWLRLIRAENVGPTTFRGLVNQYGSAQNALDALPEIARRGGARRPLQVPSREDAERELARIEGVGARLVLSADPDYPAHLRRLDAPPPVLSMRGGGAEFAARPTVAIVGSRNASIAGLKLADRIARGLGDHGFVVVSGLARGVDAAAHRASLDTGTVAVVAGGIDHVYPEEHAPLIEEIVAAGGAIVTEMPFGWIPGRRTSPAATASSPASAWPSSWSRRPRGLARCTPPDLPPNRAGRSSRFQDRRWIRGRRERTG